jgi:hypothetical protein
MVGFREYDERGGLDRTVEFIDRSQPRVPGRRVRFCREAAIQNSPGF